MKKLLSVVIVIIAAMMICFNQKETKRSVDNRTYYSNTVNQTTAAAVVKQAPLQRVPRSSEDSIAVGIEMLEESLLYYESELSDPIEEPVAVIDNVYYFHIDTLFEKTGTMSVAVQDGAVVRTTWTYEFKDVIDDSESFYNDIIRVADTMAYSNIITSRDYDANGVPRVSITVRK